MLQDLANITFGLNRGSYTASIQPLRLQHKRDKLREVLIVRKSRVRVKTPLTTAMLSRRNGGTEVERWGSLRKAEGVLCGQLYGVN